MFSELDGFNQQKIKLLARDQQLTKLTVYIIYTVVLKIENLPLKWCLVPAQLSSMFLYTILCGVDSWSPPWWTSRPGSAQSLRVSPARAIWPRLISTNRMSIVSPREKMLGSSTCLSFSLTCVALVSIDVHSHRMHQMESSPEGPLQNKLPPASNVRKSPSQSLTNMGHIMSHF